MEEIKHPLLEEHELNELRERLETRNLEERDFAFLRKLIDLAWLRRTDETVGGRPVLAHLPFGMDVIK